jgi:quercetin dioxygenase-like cupin family protein
MENMNAYGIWIDAESGVKRKILEVGKSIMMMVVHFEKGAESAEHDHPHEQLTYCLKGSFEFTVSGVKTILTPGETLYIPSHTRHGAKALEAGVLLDTFTPVREDLL